MKHTLLLLTSLAFSTAPLMAQQCELIDDNFDTYPQLAPVSNVPGWTGNMNNMPRIEDNGDPNRSLTLRPGGFAVPPWASRLLPVLPDSAAGFYQLAADIEVNGATATFSLDCSGGGVAAQAIISGSPGAYTVASIHTSTPSMSVSAPVVSILYEVSEPDQYSLYVNGIFMETKPWPSTLCATRPSATFGATAGFGGGTVYVDNVCMTAAPLNLSIGSNYCTANPHYAGGPAVMGATGSTSVFANNVTLRMTDMPPFEFGFFMVSDSSMASTPTPPNNNNLCLGGPAATIGRYNLAGQILNGGAAGEIALAIDLTAVPQGQTVASVAPGQTWYFQGWYRETVPNSSNFSDALQITFN